MNRKIAALLVITLAAGLGLALSSRLFPPARPAKPAPKLESVTLIPSPRALPDFSLSGTDGKLTKQDLLGHWTLVFIGFTHCPDICPTTLSELAVAQAQWAQSGLPNRPRLLFVSIDPGRDTPAKLAEYAAYFHPDTITATAAEPQLGKFTKSLGLVYMRVAQGDSYTMDHSSALVLLDPDAEFAGIIRPPFKPDAIARDLTALAKSRP